MQRIRLFHFEYGDPGSVYVLRRLDKVALGNGRTFYFRSEKNRDAFFVAVNALLNDVFVQSLLIEQQIFEKYNGLFQSLDFHTLERINRHFTQQGNNKMRIIFDASPNQGFNVFRNFRNFHESMETTIQILHAETTRLNYFHDRNILAALKRSIIVERERLESFTYEAYKIEVRRSRV